MITRKIWNQNKECIYVGINKEKNITVLCQLLWNKYVLNCIEIVKVDYELGPDEKGWIKFYFNNGLVEEFTQLPLTWQHLYFGVN